MKYFLIIEQLREATDQRESALRSLLNMLYDHTLIGARTERAVLSDIEMMLMRDNSKHPGKSPYGLDVKPAPSPFRGTVVHIYASRENGTRSPFVRMLVEPVCAIIELTNKRQYERSSSI